MKLRYTDRAKEDIEFAFEWYEKQKKGLGFNASIGYAAKGNSKPFEAHKTKPGAIIIKKGAALAFQ